MSAENVVQVPVKGAGGEDRGHRTLELSKVDVRVRFRLLKEAVVMYQANKRLGTHSTKTRSYVAGSNKKPWRQKGTGRARAGSRKSPIWRGGGVVFGPHPRDYSYAVHRKQRRTAVRSALLAKFRDGQVVILDGLDLDSTKTRLVASALRALAVETPCLLGTAAHAPKLVLAARNLPGVVVAPVSDFNALDVLRVRKVVLTADAFDAIVRKLLADETAPAEAAATAGEGDGGGGEGQAT